VSKTAIIFGAGSSIQAMPIVSDMVTHFKILSKKLEDITLDDIELDGCLNEFRSHITYFNSKLEFAQTPDAVMNAINSNPNLEFDRYLRSFWIYLILLQFVDRKELGLNEANEKRKYKFFDNRYYELISDYYSSAKNDYVFLSWNYDIQFELMYNEYFGHTDLYRAFDEMPVYPNYNENSEAPHLIHLNGLSGLVTNTSKDIKTIDNFISKIKVGCNLKEGLRDTVWILMNMHRKNYNVKNLLKFSFTNTEDELNRLRSILYDKLNGVWKFIFIGYSFPELNRNIDSIILNSSVHNSEIILQNPVNYKQKVQRLFDIESSRITVVSNQSDMGKFLIE